MMQTQVEAQIFLSDQRGSAEADSFQRFYTFNFGSYRADGREPFGALRLLNEDTLRPEATLAWQVDQPTQVVLLPVVGGLEYAIDGTSHFLEPGQAGVFSLASGLAYSVTNPYPAESITCLQVGFTTSESGLPAAVSQVNFDLSTPNALQPFLSNVPGLERAGFIGRFMGRQEGTYPTGTVTEGAVRRIFVFVLQGVFEVANRLLHEKDGLALTYRQEDVLEFEALSNEAVLLILMC